MTKTYSMPKNFYWGGASAANQYEGGYNEGGKGLNAIDVLTNGSATEPRKVTWKTNDGKTGVTPMTWGKEFKLPDGAKPALLDNYYYPSHEGTDFYHHYQEDIKYMAEMGFNMFRLSLNWSRICQMETTKSQIKKVQLSMTRSLMNVLSTELSHLLPFAL